MQSLCCVLYILARVWVLHTPNARWISHFQHFYSKKLKKQKKNLLQNWAKIFFYVCTKTLVECFITRLHSKWLFQPAFGVLSTRTLVEIYNTQHGLFLSLSVLCLCLHVGRLAFSLVWIVGLVLFIWSRLLDKLHIGAIH